jgi:hypothetical protein
VCHKLTKHQVREEMGRNGAFVYCIAEGAFSILVIVVRHDIIVDYCFRVCSARNRVSSSACIYFIRYSIWIISTFKISQRETRSENFESRGTSSAQIPAAPHHPPQSQVFRNTLRLPWRTMMTTVLERQLMLTV